MRNALISVHFAVRHHQKRHRATSFVCDAPACANACSGVFNGRSREDLMTRRVAAVVVALIVFPAGPYAQDTGLTVTVQSADVYKSPSTAAPVVGHASRGVALPVERNLGSWVQVAWSAAPDGIGYVHT